MQNTWMLREKAKEEIPEEKRTRCEVWTRVMGYHRPVASFNIGKQGEHKERKHFREERMECR